jgi:hypothetical protein
MTAIRISEVRKLKGLKNISWLTTRQLNKVADALSVNVKAGARWWSCWRPE